MMGKIDFERVIEDALNFGYCEDCPVREMDFEFPISDCPACLHPQDCYFADEIIQRFELDKEEEEEEKEI